MAPQAAWNSQTSNALQVSAFAGSHQRLAPGNLGGDVGKESGSTFLTLRKEEDLAPTKTALYCLNLDPEVFSYMVIRQSCGVIIAITSIVILRITSKSDL